MKMNIYSRRLFDDKKIHGEAIEKTLVTDDAPRLYARLEEACGADVSDEERIDMVRNVFARVVEQSIRHCRIAFVGFFAKLDFCIKEHGIPYTIARLLQMARKDLFDRDSRPQYIDHDIKATALLVHWLCGRVAIPESLKAHFPKADRKNTWGRYERNVLRVVVERWDDEYIWATEEETGHTIQICYGPKNDMLTRGGKGDWSYLAKVMWEGAQLNLVRLRRQEREEAVYPELIILEPDYLVNITTIAACFESYAESPFVNLINKIKPPQNTMAIHLGQISGQLLDATVHGRRVTADDAIRDYVGRQAISMIACEGMTDPDNFRQFREDVAKQRRNIEKMIGEDLPQSIGHFDKSRVMLEPSFFSEVLGIQGRMDFLYENDGDVTIIEQKSGKGEYAPLRISDPDIPEPKEQHEVQALLYRALFQYEFQKHSESLRHIMLLYSKYAKGLILIQQMPKLFLRAIKMRNLLAWSEIYYAQEGMDMLATLTPEKLNTKKVRGKLWEMYVRPQLDSLLQPIHTATPIEQAYVLRLLRFLAQEQLLAKTGSKMKADNGFASLWQDTLESKKSAGNIYDRLHIDSIEGDKGEGVSTVRLRFDNLKDADTSNFRQGDIVILYDYKEGSVPNACQQTVYRATIADITAKGVELRLRNSQTDRRAIEADGDDGKRLWAVEHDLMESASGGMYSGVYSFLSAPKRRRDLVLAMRQPDIDPQRRRRGDYGQHNGLMDRAVQARELFLIIGPPGTGKTSFGLVNMLKEEMLEEDSSILLLSYTNRAVDEICGKLVEMRSENPTIGFLRLGSELSCAPEYRDYLLVNNPATSTGKGAMELLRRTRIFCATTAALNANMSLLKLKRFSLAIIDESSQILEPHLLGLLSHHIDGVESIKRVVMIGDHKQLPAVVIQPPEESAVTEPALRAIHLTDCRHSLFERLLRQFKTADGYDPRYVYMLRKQGRMHRDIADFPNQAFYGGKLDIVPLPHQTLGNDEATSVNGIDRMLRDHRIAFVAAPRPRLTPSAKTNVIEAEMIAATVYRIYLMTQGASDGRLRAASSHYGQFSAEKTVGVIVPYRNQISTVRSAIDRYGVDRLHDITIDTVERYQGSQRDYIIYGFTIHETYQLNFLAGNVFEEAGTLIDRKLNVAMTRARLNLVIVGHPPILEANPIFSRLVSYVKEKGGYVNVDKDRYCTGCF